MILKRKSRLYTALKVTDHAAAYMELAVQSLLRNLPFGSFKQELDIDVKNSHVMVRFKLTRGNTKLRHPSLLKIDIKSCGLWQILLDRQIANYGYLENALFPQTNR